MAVTTAIKRASLDDAWDAAKVANKDNPDLRAQLRKNESLARKAVAGGSLAAVSANRRTSEFAPQGPGQVTPTEAVELWRELISLYNRAYRWVKWCLDRGLDANDAEATGVQSVDLVENPTAITDALVYEWMVGSEALKDSPRDWPGMLITVTEATSDYSGIIY